MSLKFSFNSSPPSDSPPSDHGSNEGHGDGHGHDQGHGAGHGHDQGHGFTVPGIPLPFAGAPSQRVSASSVLEMRVTRTGDEIVCDALSGDGVSYARVARRVADNSPAEIATGVRSTLARAGATLPEPLIDAVTAVVLDLGGLEEETLAALNLSVSSGADQLSTVDAALQARIGVPAGTPIRRA